MNSSTLKDWAKEKNIATLTGPVLLFGGAYSNLQALTALRAEAERLGIPPQNVICTGDTAGYCADPAGCLDLIQDWGIHAIAGNVETNLVAGTDDCGCGFGDGSRCDMFAKLWYNYAGNNVTKRMQISKHNFARPQVQRWWWADTVVFPSGKESGVRSRESLPQLPSTPNSRLWLNPGVIGMPANDGTPRTWFMTLDDTSGLNFAFHALHYDHKAAKARMLDDRRLPVSYAATLTTGIWDNTEIMPADEEAREGIPLDAASLSRDEHPAPSSEHPLRGTDAAGGGGGAPAAAPGKSQLSLKNISKMNKYTDPKDLKSFGKVAEWQEDMGNKFFDWYSGVTEGDSALSEREKALIALAVSHAIQCSYCIDAYTTNSLQAGADEEQMMEAVHVAAAVKAGTTLIYARQMQRQVEKVTM